MGPEARTVPQLCKGCRFPGFGTGEILKSKGWGSPAVSLSLAAEEGRTIHQKMSLAEQIPAVSSSNGCYCCYCCSGPSACAGCCSAGAWSNREQRYCPTAVGEQSTALPPFLW